jgi:hypothetical protein
MLFVGVHVLPCAQAAGWVECNNDTPQMLLDADISIIYEIENLCSYDGLSVLHCHIVLIPFLSLVDTVLTWCGSYHLHW